MLINLGLPRLNAKSITAEIQASTTTDSRFSLRILTFTSLFPNGADPNRGVFIYQRMAHLAARGHFVEVVAPVPYVPKWFAVGRWRRFATAPRREQIGQLTIHHPRYPLLPKLMLLHGVLMLLGSFRTAYKLHRHKRFDCIDAHYVFPDGFAAVGVAKLLRLPLLISARGTDINLFSTFWTIRPMIRSTLRAASGLIGVSRTLCEQMIRMGAPAARTALIGNGVDVVRFRPEDRQESRYRLHVAADLRVAICVASLTPAKRHALLLSAFAKVVAGRPRAALFLLGEGPERDRLAHLATRLGISTHVTFAGACPNSDMRWWYSAADISCLCSSREGWPNVLLESLACGTPVVGTNIPGITDVISAPEAGILTESNADAIAAAIERAFDTAWNRQSIRDQALQRTWAVVAEELERFVNRTVVIPRLDSSMRRPENFDQS